MPADEDRGSIEARLCAALARREFWLQQQDLARDLPRALRFATLMIAMYEADIQYLSSLVPPSPIARAARLASSPEAS